MDLRSGAVQSLFMAAAEFSDLSVRQQRAALLAIAQKALEGYELRAERVRLINSGFNATFRVDTDKGEKFALRININSHRTPANVRAEVSWTEALSREETLTVARPQETLAGGLIGEVRSEYFTSPRPVVLYSWLGGRDVCDVETSEKFWATGVAMAHLHAHTRQWVLPARASAPRLDNPLWGAVNRLDDHHLPLPPADIAFLRSILDQSTTVINRVWKGSDGQLIHADLHTGNMKWYRGRLAVLDFDDCGVGLPVQDLAVATYYLRDNQEYESALREGYGSVAALPLVNADDFEWLVAHRNVLLLTEVAGWVTAEFKAILPKYAAASVRKLRAFLETGLFSHQLSD